MAQKTIGLSRDLIIHPGETLLEILADRGMSQRELAQKSGVSEKHVAKVVNGLTSISGNFAKSLESIIGVKSSFWINLQSNFDKELLVFEERNNITDEELSISKTLRAITNHFIELKFMKRGLDEVSRVLELRRLLNIGNLTLIPTNMTQGAYRIRDTEVNIYVLYAWQRLCEMKTEGITLNKSLDVERLKKYIPIIKNIMFIDANEMYDRLVEVFAECGIVFCIVKNFKGAPVHGFIKKNESGNVMLCMTIRQSFADIFWFTLFHEISHILNGDIMNKQHIDFSFTVDEMELKANKIASNLLINESEYKRFIKERDFSLTSINKFAKQQNVCNYILIGRLQNEKYLSYSRYSDQKIRYKWAD